MFILLRYSAPHKLAKLVNYNRDDTIVMPSKAGLLGKSTFSISDISQNSMANKKILTVGFGLAGERTQECGFDSDLSLLDWDIILFKPYISGFVNYYGEKFRGKPRLSNDTSFQLKERVKHWKGEIKAAVKGGKSVFVYMSDFEEVYVATGEKKFSGTGKNQKETQIVELFDNYESIPMDLSPVKTKGQEIKLSTKNSELIAPYWQEFSSYSSYKLLFNADEKIQPCLITKYGDKPVGAIVRFQNSAGALILVPDIDFYSREFLDEDGRWNEKGEHFSSSLMKSIVSLDSSLKGTSELTPEPEWVKEDVYKLNDESMFTARLLNIESKLEKIQIKKESYIDQILKN